MSEYGREILWLYLRLVRDVPALVVRRCSTNETVSKSILEGLAKLERHDTVKDWIDGCADIICDS